MLDLLAITTLMVWPVIPLFWIPLHFAAPFFRRLGFFTYIMPLITWVPVAYLIYMKRSFLLQSRISFPPVISITGILLLISGALLHIWTARLLGLWGITGMPEISSRVKEKLVTGGPFSVVRHPTYFAHTLIFSGVFLITGAVSVGMLMLLDCITVNTVIIPLEERELLARFADEYLLYKKKVPSRFLPWIRRK
jgi:protein-S-isoprenylcysteine O-methyltransferase Ste14